jgi:salicylate hydroxylase
VRIERYKLQNALLAAVPKGLIQLGKKLGAVEEGRDGVRLAFKDGSVAGPFDLVIGADGIRSVGTVNPHPSLTDC